MSVAGYLTPGTGELRMASEGIPGGGLEGLGLEGEVLTGKKSVEARLGEYPARVASDKCYENVADYDPVLRAHCRL
jgi:hypothetical protein